MYCEGRKAGRTETGMDLDDEQKGQGRYMRVTRASVEDNSEATYGFG